MRARRLLLNDPPATKGRRSGADSALEAFISGIGSQYPATACVFHQIKPEFQNNPRQFMEMGRLLAIYALKASQVFEHVLELTLGPLSGDKVDGSGFGCDVLDMPIGHLGQACEHVLEVGEGINTVAAPMPQTSR